jgi:hypothetical protein
VSTGPGKGPDEVTREWLMEILSRGGYQATASDKDANTILAKHESKPNIVVTIRKNQGMITIQHWWPMKKPNWGQDKALVAALNQANAQSWFDTFAIDNDGDLTVSAYITLAQELAEHDVLGFLDKEPASFATVIKSSGLMGFLK